MCQDFSPPADCRVCHTPQRQRREAMLCQASIEQWLGAIMPHVSHLSKRQAMALDWVIPQGVPLYAGTPF
jgi:hypothetical protein